MAPVLWTVTVRTGNVEDAATNARVSIRLKGKNGSMTPDGNLDNGKPNFKRNSTDTFTVNFENVGEIETLTVWRDPSEGPGWFLVEIGMTAVVDGVNVNQMFQCNQWLSVNHGDHQVERTLIPKP